MTRASTALAGLVAVFLALVPANAQETSLSVTVTPPLIQLTIGPGESWASSLKIVNNNAFDVTYYAVPVDFEADGEEGKGTITPVVESASEGVTLGSWVAISKDAILVPRGSSADVPFTVSIPADAAPGGHYAAILVGTQSGEELLGSAVRVSSYVSSLLFVRIKGEIDERARIREFRSERMLYQRPEAEFALRFENIGNTHLRPQGEIVLYNMWGKERGRVQLHQKSGFGNVLPASTRRFSFVWQGEESVFDIGRYSAVVTLSYGEDEKHHATATTYFWVVPVVPVATTLGSILAFVLLTAWLIRRYVRRTLAIERRHLGISDQSSARRAYGAADVRAVPHPETPEPSGNPRRGTVFGFFQEHSLVFFFLALCTAAGFGLWMYLDAVLTPERTYEITNVSASEDVGNDEE